MSNKMEKQDLSILKLLQSDSSQSSSAIAEKLNMSQSPCWRRINRLQQDGIIMKEVALLDRRELGMDVVVFATINLTSSGRQNLLAFEEEIVLHPEVMECYLMTGEFDYLIRVVTPDLQSYQEFLDQRLTQFKGISHVKSSFSLKPICYKTQLPLGHHLKEKPEI